MVGSDKKNNVSDDSVVQNMSRDYVINVDIKTMQYRTISENHIKEHFDIPLIGKYDELMHRLSMKFVYKDDLENFLCKFSGENIKKISDNGTSVISDEIRMIFCEKMYWKNINVVIYHDENRNTSHAIISFFDITDKKSNKMPKNTDRGNMYKNVSKMYDFIFTVNLIKNTYSVVLQNENFSCRSQYNSFRGFAEWFASRIEGDRRDFIFEQLSIESITKAFNSGQSEIYFVFRIKDNNGTLKSMSMCVSNSSNKENVIVLCRFNEQLESKSFYLPVRKNITVETKYSKFIAGCLNCIYYENDMDKCMNMILSEISRYFNCEYVTVFMLDDIFPSVMKPAYFYSLADKKLKGTVKLTGYDYACELKRVNDDVKKCEVMINTIDELIKINPIIGNYMKSNNIVKVITANVLFGNGSSGFMCIESKNPNIIEDENAVRIASLFVGNILDRKVIIKERKEIKQIKKRHKDLLNLVYNRMKNGIVQFEVISEKNDTLKLLNYNNAFCEILGCTVDVIKRCFFQNFYQFAIKEDRPFIENAVKLLVNQRKQNTQTEVRILNNESDIKWVHINMFRIDSSETDNVVIQAEFTDITVIKQEQLEKELVYDAMLVGVVKCILKNKNIEFVSANDKFYELFGTDEINGIPAVFSNENYQQYINCHISDMIDRKSFSGSFCVDNNSERKKWISVSSKCIGTRSGFPVYVSAIFDITEREEAFINLEKTNMELKIRTERYSLIEKSTEEKIVEYDVLSDKLIVQENSGIYEDGSNEISDFLGDDYNGRFREYIYEEDVQLYIDIMKKLMINPEKGSIDYRTNLFNEKDNFVWYRSYYTSVADNNGNIIKIISRIKNIENEKTKQKKLELQIKSDPMTGLLNKIAAKSDISDSLLNHPERNDALMIVDVDNFKSVNDNLGHMFGDAVLKNIASAIQRTFRSTDIVGRIGGDEFIVFMKNTNVFNAESKAQELCSSIKRNYSGNDKSVDVSCSIGISYSNIDGDDYDTLFEKADTAMYFSKKNGKNKFTSYSVNMQKSDHELTREDSRAVRDISGSKFDMEIVSFALGLMSNSKNVDSSVNILLEQTGNKFDMSDIFLFECDALGEFSVSNSWSEKNVNIPDIPCLQIFESKEFDERGLLCIDDCREYSDYGEFKSLVAVKFDENAVINGIIIFGDRKNVRKWNNLQKNTLYELSRLISVFTALRDERRKDKEKITVLKTTDALTGLYNFESFKLRASEIISGDRKSEIYALFYMDINGFAYVNDNFGYNAGDRMLCAFADHIKNAVKSSREGCACRVYSDYFILLLAGDSRSEIMLRVKSSNDNFFEMQRKIYPAGSIGLSTGIYFIGDEHDDNITVAIDNADLARQKAKRTNQNTYEIYTSDLRRSRSNELSIIGELYRAMEKGKIELFLQPKFKLDTREIIGAEALARWRNDDSTLKYPSEFVPALEKIGYIVKLDFYMYEKVLKCMRKWIDMGINPMPISVNFSRKNSLEEGFYERVYSLAETYGVDSNLIEIETTESAFISDLNRMIENMRRFRNAGFKIDIDDFGTGYSSLNMLVSAPVDIVKIDKSFLKNIDKSQFERDYVKQMCRMISTARKDIIFEGVETENQAKFLLDCGFTMAQGYLFDKPIPLEEFENKYIFLNKKNKK
jgi:diguanylate cyclase (GGDEF)-like protein